MGLRTAKFLQAFFVVMLAWYVYSFVGGIHWLLALLVVILSATNVITIWMLRHNQKAIARLCRYPLVERYAGLVCKATGQQPPLGRRPEANAKQFLLSSSDSMHVAVERAKQIVRGHDAVLGRMMGRVFENTQLRKSRRSNRSLGPLASFLLAGRPGIGKRYLSRVVSKLLYKSGRVEVFECDRITAESLIGSKGRTGDLLELVRNEPFQMVIFENIERASVDVCGLLQRLLTSGELRQPGVESAISFQHVTVVLTTAKCESIVELEAESTTWEQRARERLLDDAQLDDGLLNAVDELLFCEPPSKEVQAEVISLLLQKECRAHGIRLSHVDPVILGTQVLQIEDATGFEHAPNRIKRLLSKPLVAATADGHEELSLRVSDQPLHMTR